MPRGSGGNVAGFKLLSTPNAPTIDGVSTSIGSASVSFTAPSDTGDAAISSYVVTAVNESTGASDAGTGTSSPVSVSVTSGGTFKIRIQALNAYGPGRLSEYDTGNSIFSGAELYSWGVNTYGRLGLNDLNARSSPTQIGSLTTWSEIAVCESSSFGQKTDGTLWAWGYNGGRLGDGTTDRRSSPVQIGALTNWGQVASGAGAHGAAIKTDGTLWTWGNGGDGQLGLGDRANQSSPVQVGALADWYYVSAGRYNTGSIKTDGTLWMWGWGGTGGNGDNSTISRSSPIQVGVLTTWSQVSVGKGLAGAVKTDGTLWTWGANPQGELGDGTVVDKSSPIQIGALTDWAQVSASINNMAAVKTDGTLWTWGLGNHGVIGDGTAQDKSSPVQIGALTNWAQISVGLRNMAAVKTDGTLWTWGLNGSGTLGNNTQGNATSRSSPIQVGALTDWVRVGVGIDFMTATVGVTS